MPAQQAAIARTTATKEHDVLRCTRKSLRLTSVVLLLAGWGGGSSGSGASTVSVVSAAPSTISLPSPAPAPTSTPRPKPVCDAPVTTTIIVQSDGGIGAGHGSNRTAIDQLGFPAGIVIHNVSTNGKGLETALGLRETELFPFFSSDRPSILLLQQGTNDLGPGAQLTGSYLYAVLTSFVATAHAIGFNVAVDTVLPRQDSAWTPAMEQQRLAYNNCVRANTAGADAINDIASDPVIGDGTSPATSAYSGDGLHPDAPEQDRLAILNAAALSPLLHCPARASSR